MLPVATSAPTHDYQQARRVRPSSEATLIRAALAGSQADLQLLFRTHWPRASRSAFPRGQRLSLCDLLSWSAGWRRDACPTVLVQIAAEPRNPEASTDLASPTASGDQEEPGVHAMRVPLAHGSSHDLDAASRCENCACRTARVTRSRRRGVAAPSPNQSYVASVGMRKAFVRRHLGSRQSGMSFATKWVPEIW